jgi:hypothetical protein
MAKRIKVGRVVKLLRKIEKQMKGHTNDEIHQAIGGLVASSIERALEFSRVPKSQREFASQLAYNSYKHIVTEAATSRKPSGVRLIYARYKHMITAAGQYGR